MVRIGHMVKIKCPECGCKRFEEGNGIFDCDKGTYKLKCQCDRCGNTFTLFFKKVEVLKDV